MSDEIIVCIQCEQDFIVTGSDLKKIQHKGFDIPRRCPDCRRHKLKEDENRWGRSKKKSRIK